MKYLTTDDLVVNILFWNSIMETFKQGLFILIVQCSVLKLIDFWFSINVIIAKLHVRCKVFIEYQKILW